MKVRNLLGLGLAAISLLSLNGCGGSGANVITVTVSSTSNTLILGQTATLTATVSGATNSDVNWTPQFVSGNPPCQYTFTQTNGKTSPVTACPKDGSFGTLTNLQTTGTATYTAPGTLPSPTTYPGLIIIVTAQSVQNTGKEGTVDLTLISGISVVLTPSTASVPTQEQQQFSVLLTNDIGNKGVTWSLTQNVPFTNSSGTAVNYPQLATCSPTCGTITVPDSSNPDVALYTAPATIPTVITPAQTNNSNCPQNVTVVATSNSDNTELTIGTITIVTGGPITFSGISPTIAPQGATLWDIYLNAPNISSTSVITLTDAAGGKVPKNSTSGQIKVLFPLPIANTTTTTTTTSTCTNTTTPTSTGALLRLDESDLAVSGPITVSVADPAQTVTQSGTGSFTYNIIPVRPTSTASVPDDIVQGKLSQQIPVTIDGGYFGPGGGLASPSFDGNGLAKNCNPTCTSTSRQLNTLLETNQINSSSPGLYTLSVSSSDVTPPVATNPSITNMALFPDYSSSPPAVVSTTAAGYLGIPAGTNPSAIDIDPDIGVLVVAEAGAPASATPPTAAVPSGVQFYSIGTGTLIPIDSTGAMCVASCPVTSVTFANVSLSTPTGISVDRVNHTVAIVNYGNQSVTVLPIPVPGATSQSPAPGTPFTLDISGALQGSVSPAPIPYSIGVDPDSNLAIVAYSSTSSSSAANVGFIVNLNPNTVANPWGCTLDHNITPMSTKVGQCLTAQVTLNTGVYPQVAVTPHGHLAVVTPGGSGVVRGVDVTKPSTSNVILSSTLTAGLVTVTIDTTKCPPPLPAPTSTTNACPFSMIPGNSGSVLITGVKPGTPANSVYFNGVFPVNVLSSNSFSYVVPNLTVTDTGTQNCQTNNSVTTCATVFYGNPNQTFSISSTTQGVAINPVTHTAAMADANATGQNGSQIWLLNSLDQSVTSFGFSANCTAYIPSCASTPEFLGTTGVAWQPYTNEVVSYNPHLNQVSVSDPVSSQRYAFACNTNGPLPISFVPGTCVTDPTSPTQQQTFQGQIVLNGTGTATLTVQNGTTNTLNLFGGVAVDPGSNQAFVLKSGSGTIDVIDLGGPGTATPIKPIHVSEVIVPSPTPGPGVIGGIPNALVPQGTLTCTTPVAPATTCDLAGLQVFGTGFNSSTQVRLDGVSIPPGNVQLVSPRQLSVTIPASFLGFPHHYALQAVTNNGTVNSVQSNAVDFIVVQAVDLSKVCTNSSGGATNTMPTSVAIADQIVNRPFAPMALVSVTGCNSVVAIDINPTVAPGNPQPNPHFGQFFGSPVTVGNGPQGIAISQPLGLAVVANNGGGTASILDLTPLPTASPVEKVPDVATGTNPTGVAIDDAIGVAIVTNTGSNTISSLNLELLFPSGSTAAATTLTPVSIGGIQQPLAVAIDPNRGTNNQGLAVVTSVELSSGSASVGGLQSVEIGFITPSLSTTISSGSVSGSPTGIVFDPTVATGTTNPGAFYANSSGTNTITEFNPDTGGGSSVNVGINPTSLAINPQTGAILTSNTASNTISIVDTLSNPFATRQTLGFPGSGTFGVAIDQFTNLAVIVDQANMRVFLFPMPN